MKHLFFNGHEFNIDNDELKKGDLIKRSILMVGEEHQGDDVINVTPEMLAQAVKNFTDGAYGQAEMPLNFVHDQGSAAAAWIKNLELSEDKNELLATFKVTEKGAKELNGGNYRYPSIEAETNGYKRHDGVKFDGFVVVGCALLNRPQQKKIDPISKFEEKTMTKSKIKFNADQVADELETFTPDELLSVVEKAMELMPDDLTDEQMQRLNVLDIEEESIEMEGDKKESVEMKEMRNKMALLQKDNDDSKKTLLFTNLRNSGHILPAQKDDFMNLTANEADKFAVIAKKGSALDFTEIGHSKEDGEPAKLDEQQKVTKFGDKVNALMKKESLNFSDASAKVAKDNPDLGKAAGFI